MLRAPWGVAGAFPPSTGPRRNRGERSPECSTRRRSDGVRVALVAAVRVGQLYAFLGALKKREANPSPLAAAIPAGHEPTCWLAAPETSLAGVDGVNTLSEKRGERVAQALCQGGAGVPTRQPGEFGVVATTLRHVPFSKSFGA
jgi:hypothetical protein